MKSMPAMSEGESQGSPQESEPLQGLEPGAVPIEWVVATFAFDAARYSCLRNHTHRCPWAGFALGRPSGRPMPTWSAGPFRRASS